MARDLIVSSNPRETRVALLEDGVVAELFLEREAQRGIVGSIYKGRITRVLPGMQSAFVDLGLERDAFLHASDAIAELPDNELSADEVSAANRAPIEERLHEGEELVVQVLKEPMGTKGARITSHVSLPGRYLVLMPTVEHVGVSRKITSDEERRRLKTVLKEFRQEREAEAFLRDGRYLARTWDECRALAARQRAPVLLYREPSLVERLLRDLLSDEMAAIKLDNERDFQRALELVRALEPALEPRVRLHNGAGGIMEEHGVSAELERALRSKVWLPGGGYIVINQTEALVAIDVNTGRFVGKDDLEDTLLKANLDAVREIVRQIRLRDLGGIIVVDFIDMEERKSSREVLRALEQELRKDRSPTKLLSVNEFGLVILTRKRVKQSLDKLLLSPCPYCSGSGQVKSVSTVCSEIYDEVRKLAPDMPGQKLVLRVNPEIARALEGDEANVLKSLSALTGGELTVLADPLLHQEQFDVVAV
jgi:ribonuclease G